MNTLHIPRLGTLDRMPSQFINSLLLAMCLLSGLAILSNHALDKAQQTTWHLVNDLCLEGSPQDERLRRQIVSSAQHVLQLQMFRQDLALASMSFYVAIPGLILLVRRSSNEKKA